MDTGRLDAAATDRRTLAWALPVSFLGHAAAVGLFLAGLVFWPHSCTHGVARGGEDGERGAGGSGGQTIEIAVQGAAVAVPAPVAQLAPTAAPMPNTGAGARADAPSRTAPHVPIHPRAERHAPRAAPTEERHPWDPPTLVAAQEHPEETAGVEARPSRSGTNSQFTSGGLRAGSVGHQRALLPRAAMCNDPVAGTWRALTYNPLRRDWFRATLQIQRDGAALTGTIVTRIWYGSPDASRPPPCTEIGLDLTVDQPGRGTVEGERVVFGARSYRIRSVNCNPGGDPLDYAPDNFSGTIDASRQEFQSVNNDGHYAFNEPTVFRRIACRPGDDAEPEAAAPGGTPPAPSSPAPLP